MTATPGHDNVSRVRQVFDALDRHDAREAVGHYHADAVLVDQALQATMSGRDEIAAYFDGQFETLPDARFDEVEVVAAGDWAVYRGALRGTHDGPLTGIEPTHRPVDVPFCNVVRWRDGRIAEDHVYLDLHTLLVQIGHAVPLTESA